MREQSQKQNINIYSKGKLQMKVKVTKGKVVLINCFSKSGADISFEKLFKEEIIKPIF